MSEFPNAFVDEVRHLPEGEMDLDTLIMVRNMEDQGYEVRQGMTEYYAGSIAVMATQQHIRLYCPNDATEKRFGTKESTEKWLRKGGGRAAFLLLQNLGEDAGQRLAGYGWTGPATTPEIEDGETTFAFRIGESHRGQSLGTPFAKLIIEGSKALFGADNFWLETWSSNQGAVSIYEALGFQTVHYELAIREEPGRKTQLDSRLYMKLKEFSED